MELRKKVLVDKIEVNQVGCVHIRISTSIYDGDQLVANSFHRHVVAPGDDYSAEDARVQAICAATHTDDVVAAFRAAAAASGV